MAISLPGLGAAAGSVGQLLMQEALRGRQREEREKERAATQAFREQQLDLQRQRLAASTAPKPPEPPRYSFQRTDEGIVGVDPTDPTNIVRTGLRPPPPASAAPRPPSFQFRPTEGGEIVGFDPRDPTATVPTGQRAPAPAMSVMDKLLAQMRDVEPEPEGPGFFDKAGEIAGRTLRGAGDFASRLLGGGPEPAAADTAAAPMPPDTTAGGPLPPAVEPAEIEAMLERGMSEDEIIAKLRAQGKIR